MVNKIQNKIKYIRKSEGINLSQQELADKLGITRYWLSLIENGRVPGGDVMLKLSIIFDKDIRDIFFTKDVAYSLQNEHKVN